jgi:hypothetical protein
MQSFKHNIAHIFLKAKVWSEANTLHNSPEPIYNQIGLTFKSILLDILSIK